MAIEKATSPSTAYAAKIKAIRRELKEEYLQPHTKPWIIGFSGGKDSTLLAQLVVECLLSISPDERKRQVYIVSNDTLVESPVFQEFVNKILDHLDESLRALHLPTEVVKTSPKIEESFWVNLLGRGYPAPNRMFRWCTDRMKVRPTSKFIRDQVSKNGEAILLLGVRRAESAQRAKNLARHDNALEGRLSPHGDFKGCYIFTPIKDLTTEEVWVALLNSRPPWGGTYKEIVTLYKSANGSECPFVLSTDDAPSCGTSSARFGCWTCTVVDKDNSLDSLITAGHEHLEPLSKYRKRLKEVSDNPEFRSKVRRNGQPGLGPLTMEARRMLLNELFVIQTDVGFELISKTEVLLIQEQWSVDESEALLRDLEKIEAKPEINACAQ
jgi:DNA sulfur modification protein DndC